MLSQHIRHKIRATLNFLLASYFHIKYHRPSQRLRIIGITGTDGKTTTSNILYHILKTAGYKTGLVTTINAEIGGTTVPTGLHVTSPNPKQIQYLIAEMVKNNLEYAILETTSHALTQNRYAYINYDGIIITNVSHEHLDYHKTYREYLAAKSKIIDKTNKDGFIILNRDDQSFKYLYEKTVAQEKQFFTYSIKRKNTDIYATNIKISNKLTQFTIVEQNRQLQIDITTPLIGQYNIYNILGAVEAAIQLGVKVADIKQALQNFPQLEGRWEVIQERPFKIVVDFAHTPNALEQVLKKAKEITKGNIILVFGTAGQRDKSKRPMMGEIAEKYADKVILTAEDPRGESVDHINKEITRDVQIRDKFISIPDRREAIKKAISIAQKDDLVLITGKGHEQSMNLDGKTEIPWDDREVVREAIGALFKHKPIRII